MLAFKTSLPAAVGLRHEDIRTSGIPDISLTWNGRTSWIEVKHATPSFESTGIQELTMARLARAGIARYIVYWEKGDRKRTLVVVPGKLSTLAADEECLGHNHEFVVQCFQRLLS